MKFPISWLNDYLDMTGITAKEYAHELTMSGSKVEGVENAGDGISNVVVGHLVSVTKHPNADTLSVCQVDVGDETIQVVTGADNISEGDYVPVAKHGAHLPGGINIKKGKLRGETSNGMLCSYQELALSKEDVPYAIEDGILILPEPYAPGTDIKQIFSLDEDVVEFEITSNRPDCFSVIGLARETALTFKRPFHVPTPSYPTCGGNIADYAKINVEAPDLCPRYTARVVKNLKIEESPKWLRDRLALSGIRAINNIVDITNYVLLEYGQPMHAFDLSFLEGGEINVRRAKEGETITTLDEQDHALDPSMLVICDAKKPVAVAGVMGGLNSEITENTKTLLFESANFDGPSIRLTAKKLGMRTESSSRYEKGLDHRNLLPALDRACELIVQLGAGEVVDGVIDVDNASDARASIPFCPKRINALLGTDLDGAYMTKLLTDLGCCFVGDDVVPPSWRPDLLCEADLAEEVARFYGYNAIGSTALRGETTHGVKTYTQQTEDLVHDTLTAQGLYQTMTFSFTSPKELAKLSGKAELMDTVVISNPLGEENSVMRTTLLASVLETLSTNYNHRNERAWIYELANVYIPQKEQKLPDEHKVIALAMYGDCDFFDLKGAVESLLDSLRVRGAEFVPESGNATFHPGRCARILCRGEEIGIIGEVHPSVASAFGIGTRAYAGELRFDKLCDMRKSEIKYKPLPKFPAVSRDIAMLVDTTVGVADIERIIRSCSGSILEETKLFDVYQGKQIPDGKKSVAYSIIYRAPDRTLTDEEVSGVFAKTVSTLEQKLGATLR
ncbi:MAG: phenylalanine--tRNA ligase subunit beta [Ruminococcaceae bacterium]|nr:phenylalanine--tRNA ligase subunit beta [Oscillospiraceae bacterium]